MCSPDIQRFSSLRISIQRKIPNFLKNILHNITQSSKEIKRNQKKSKLFQMPQNSSLWLYNRVSQDAFERLEPCGSKDPRTVLRGLGAGNRVWLPGGRRPLSAA
jgi:hypothetical protein